MKYYSKSNLQSRCRVKYANNSDSIAAAKGRSLHYAIDKCLEGNNIKAKDVFTICENEGVPRILHEDVYHSFESWLENIGRELMSTFSIVSIESKEEKQFKHGRPIARIELNDSVGIQGMIDFIGYSKEHKRYEVFDWKSGYLSEDCDLELTINGMIAMELYNLDAVESRLYSVSADIFKSKRLKRSKFDEYKNTILKAISFVSSLPEDHTEITSYCQYCGMKSDCDDYISLLSGEPSTINKDAPVEDLLSEFFRLKSMSSSAKKESELIEDVVKLRINNDETFAHNGYEYYFKATNSKEYDTQAVYNAIIDIGYNPDSMLSIKGGELNNLLKEIKKESGSETWKKVKEIIQSHTKIKKGTPKLKRRLIK